MYIDDLLIISNDTTEQEKLKEFLNQTFEMKDLGEVQYLV